MDRLQRIKSVEKNHNVLTSQYSSYNLNPRILFSNIKQFFKNIKYAYQRITRGYCDADIWNLSDYISDMLYLTLNKLADTTHGYPGVDIFEDTKSKEDGFIDEEYGCHGAVRWESYLKDMAEHFYNTVESHEDIPINQEISKAWEEKEKYVKFCGCKPDSNIWVTESYDGQEEQLATATDKWLQLEKDASEFRRIEKDKAFDMLKEWYFQLWD